MTVEELKAILEEVPNDCEIKVLNNEEYITDVETIRYRRTFKKDGYFEELLLEV